MSAGFNVDVAVAEFFVRLRNGLMCVSREARFNTGDPVVVHCGLNKVAECGEQATNGDISEGREDVDHVILQQLVQQRVPEVTGR